MKSAGVLIAGGLFVGLGLWAMAARAQSPRQGTTTVERPGRSVAARVADAIATRDPAVMRELADELEREGHRESAEGLRMAADLSEAHLRGAP